MEKIKKYICTECGNECNSPQDGAPLLMGWENGHWCDFILIGEYENMNDREFVNIDGETYYLLGAVYYN